MKKLFALACSAAALSSQAAQGSIHDVESPWTISGHLSVVAGKVLQGGYPEKFSGETSLQGGVECPCYVSDWGYGSYYGGKLDLAQETKAGIQVQYALSPQTSLTGQLLQRQGRASIPSAYLKWNFAEDWDLKIGRKPLPMYALSEVESVGALQPWINPPQEVYGWQNNSFNGIHATRQASIQGWDVTARAYVGSEDNPKSSYYAPENAGDTRVQWKSIAGAGISAAKGRWEARANVIRADSDESNPNPASGFSQQGSLGYLSFAATYDAQSWFAIAEASFGQTSLDDGTKAWSTRNHAYFVGAGIRRGSWTLFASTSAYDESNSDATLPVQGMKRHSAVAKYNLDSNSSFKLQIHRALDPTGTSTGETTAARIAFERVFF